MICGAERNDDSVIARNSATVLRAVLNGLREDVRVGITGYVPGPSASVDRNGTVYWTTLPTVGTDRY